MVRKPWPSHAWWLTVLSHHICWSLAPYYIQMHKQLACQEPAWCSVKPYQGRISAGTARSGFRERHREGGRPQNVWCILLLRWACFWKLSFCSEVIIGMEWGKQRKRGRFAKCVNQSSTNLFPLRSLTSSTFLSVLGALLCSHSGSTALGSSFSSRVAQVFSHRSCFKVHCAPHLCIFLCFSLCWGGTHPPQTFTLTLPVTVVAAQLRI